MHDLYSLQEAGRGSDLTFLLEPLTAIFGDKLEQLTVTDFFATTQGDVRTFTLVLAVKESLLMPIPGFEALRLGVVRDSDDEWPLIYCEVSISDTAQSLSIMHFPLDIEIDNPYLQPVSLTEVPASSERFSFEVEGSFIVDDNLTIEARLEEFSVPAFEISGTGLRLALDNCRLITRGEDVDSAITDLGFTSAFRGLHAASATLHWTLPMQLHGEGLPGLRLQLENAALGNQGVSVDASLSWPVLVQDGQFNPTQTEMLGFFMDPEWSYALASVNVGIRANVPVAVGAGGYVRVPFLDAIFGLDIFINYAGEDEYAVEASLSLAEDETVSIPLGADYEVELTALNISGKIDADDRFEFEGLTGCSIVLPGVTVDVDAATLKFVHAPEGDTFRLNITRVTVEDIGTLDESELVIKTQRSDTGELSLESFYLNASIIWSDIAGQVIFNQVPDSFPLPPDDAQMTLKVRWQEGEQQLSLQTELQEVDHLWRFIPQAQRPQVAKANIDIALNKKGAGYDGELALSLRLRLPEIDQFPGLQDAGLGNLVKVDTGDEEGWIDVRFEAVLDADGDSIDGEIKAILQRPLNMVFNLPGMVLPSPPLEISISQISITLSDEDEQTEGEFRLQGGFVLRPILPADLGGLTPPAMAVQLEKLLAIAHLYDLQGTVDVRLGIGEAGGYCVLDGTFDSAGLEVDLFDMLTSVSSAMPASGGPQTEQIDLDIDVSLQLSKLSLSVGQLPGSNNSSDEVMPFAFGLSAALSFAGQQAEMSFALSSESFSFGIDELALPIALPALPMRRADLDELRDANGRWDARIWQQTVEPLIDATLNTDGEALVAARSTLQSLEDNPKNDDPTYAEQVFQLRYRTIPALQKKVFHNTGKKFLVEAVLAIYQVLGELSNQVSQDSYQGMVEVYQDAVDLTLGSLKFDTGMQLVIRDAKFVLPFSDPSNIRVEGGASLQGFAPDSPLKPLSDLVFTLGLSSDAIYFSVEGGADPIPLPDFGRYPGNAVVFDRLIIGYGYSKNSLLVDFAGELMLSPALIADADTSSRLGMGIRLPNHSRLKFKLDLIPVVLGEVDFVLPLVAFDINLRSDNPPLPPSADICVPAWDGLQTNVPGVFRADLKRYKYAPFFGPLPAPNRLQAYDVDIGNEQLGLTVICDDYYEIMPLLGMVPIPFLADTVPFFDRLCVNLRLAGFGINFDLQRPFPSPDPLLIFELMGFLADPSLPIDPAGRLANLMWAQLKNGRITLPPAISSMFPEQGNVLRRDLDVRIDVGMVIALAQQLGRVLGELQQRLAETGSDLDVLINDLRDNPPSLEVDDLLNELPRALRRVELNGSFIGFKASAVFLLVSPDELRASLQSERPAPPSAPPIGPTVRWRNVAQDRFRRNPLRNWRAINYGLKRGQLGDWRIIRGSLRQFNNVGDNSPGRYGAMLIRETNPLNDVRIGVDVQSSDNDGIGVVFHVQGRDSFYRFRMTSEQGQWHLMRLKKGVSRVLYQSRSAFKLGKAYRLRIQVRSVPQHSAGLSSRFDPRRLKSGVVNQVSRGRSKKPRFNTHIRVWVDDSLWCDVVDNDQPLTEGQVGLDSWWNTGARFDNFRVDQAERRVTELQLTTSQNLAREVLPVSGQGNTILPEQVPGAPWLVDDLAGFANEDLLQALPEGTSNSAVVVVSRITLLGRQQFRFVGIMQMNGEFHLLSAADVASLTLPVAGMSLELPLNIKGRVRLDGYSAGADSWAQFRASLFGEWDVLPAQGGALVRLVIGSEAQPVILVADSEQHFRAQGKGELQLFANRLRVSGEVDISQQYIFLRGETVLRHETNVSVGIPVLELALTSEGRIGPGRDFYLSGGGQLQLLGRSFNTVNAEISPNGIMLETRLQPDNSIWSIRGFELRDVELALRGRVTFAETITDVKFEGRGRMQIADVHIDGECYISASSQQWCLGASGRLNWQGQDWLQGAVELCNDRLSIEGQSRFAINLTPTQMPANLQIAGLMLNATISGGFELRSSGRLASCDFLLDWTLGVKLPGAQAEQQMLPIAAQRMRVDKQSISSRNTVTLADLLDIDGLTLFSLEGISLPVPGLSSNTSTDIYLHPSLYIDPPSVTLPFKLTTIDAKAPDGSDNQEVFNLGLFKLYSFTPSVDIPSFTLPIPVLSNSPPVNQPNADPLLSIPELSMMETPINGEVKLENVKLSLKLKWQNGRLGIWVRAGSGRNRTEQFLSFDNLMPTPMSFILPRS